MRQGFFCAALLAAVAILPSRAVAASLGIAAFGGASIPIAQDDTDSGPQFGLRVPINLVPLLTVEPYFAYSSLDGVTETFSAGQYTRSGFDVTAFGLNAILGGAGLVPVVPLYPFVGIASHTLSRDGSDDIKETGYELGLGVGFSVPHGIGIDARGGFDFVVTNETSRKFVNVTLGVSYKISSLP